MRKTIAAAVLSSMLFASAAGGTAFAASPNHETIPVPGDTNCQGQVMAYLAQGNDAVPGPGMGNVAKQVGVSVKDVKALVDAFCATP